MTFKIKGVGKIRNSEFSISPLTIFIGKNDSGKTYAATSLWAVINYIKSDLVLDSSLELEVAEFVENTIEGVLENRKFEQSLDNDFLYRIREYIQQDIDRNSTAILRDNFKFQGFGEAHLSFHGSSPSDIKLEMELEPEAALKKDENIFERTLNKDSSLYSLEFALCANKDKDTLSTYRLPPIPIKLLRKKSSLRSHIDTLVREYILGMSYFGVLWKKFSRVIYIPAARTGIMLGLNYFIEGEIASRAESNS